MAQQKKTYSAITARIQSCIKEDLDPGKRKISFSQMKVYTECPHRWNLTYAKKLFPFNSSIDSVFGSAFHETIQEYLKLLFNVSVKSSEEFKMFSFLQESLIRNYKEEKKKNNNNHFTTPELLNEYYEDGCEILKYIKRKRKVLFDRDNYILLGIEIPILSQAIPAIENIFFEGYIDIILQDKESKRIVIKDFKTSKQGWSKYQKTDDEKIAQILLYKKFFSEQYGIPLGMIDVSFFIVKRKLWENSQFPQPRVQQFEPANGTQKMNKATETLNKFIYECFDYDGKIIDRVYPKNPGDACKFCPFKDLPDLCNKKNS